MPLLSRFRWSPAPVEARSPCGRTLGIAAAAALCAALLPGARADWPEFRGPTGDGHVANAAASSQVGFPVQWSETNNVAWKTAIPHRGWSAPVILGGQVWVTTATEDGRDLFAIGLEAATGKILFHEKVRHVDQPEPLGNGASMNSYATPSAVIESGRVYVHFGAAATACLDTSTGKILWKREDLRCRRYRGPASSPFSLAICSFLPSTARTCSITSPSTRRPGQPFGRPTVRCPGTTRTSRGRWPRMAICARPTVPR